MPIADIDITSVTPAATPIDGATLLDVVLKSQGSARLKRRVTSRLVFSQITVEDYVTNREGVKQKLLSVPVFGASSLTELERVLAAFVETQVISPPTDEPPYRLPECLVGITMAVLASDGALPASLSRLVRAVPDIASYPIQGILEDPWRFRNLLRSVRSVGKAKAAIIEQAVSAFITAVRAIEAGQIPEREYLAYCRADLLPPQSALDHCILALPETMGGIVRDRYRISNNRGKSGTSMVTIAEKYGVSRQSATKLLKQGVAKLSEGPGLRAARRLLALPVSVAARAAAAQVLEQPVRDAHVESYLFDEPYLRLAVVIAHNRPNEWITSKTSG